MNKSLEKFTSALEDKLWEAFEKTSILDSPAIVQDFFSDRMTEVENGYIRLNLGSYDSDSPLYGVECQVKEEENRVFFTDIKIFEYPGFGEAKVKNSYTFESDCNHVKSSFIKPAKICAKDIVDKMFR